ncbi:MAG: type 2 lantipeptide synthetase LanM family protein [Catenulisporales bacterium]|nr:type 2 lantipeptide synthetase LanM family protein [Catenulisporales bacterium]
MTSRFSGEFAGALGRLVEPVTADLAARLAGLAAFAERERTAIVEATARAVTETVHRKVSRVLLLELNAAGLAGRLTAESQAERWTEFLALADDPAFWRSLSRRYPTLNQRLDVVMERRARAAWTLAERLAADRHKVTALIGSDSAELVHVEFGAGDTHRGGQSVAILDFGEAKVVYKPRPVDVDRALARLLNTLFSEVPAAERIRVPAAIGTDYGWAEFIPHRYCATDAELATFYRNVGHWLAVMRLLGGSDLHTENVIAHGPVPVVVDCETLFSTLPDAPPTGLGEAVDTAAKLVDETVLRVGMLPNRGSALGWRGVDSSSVGALPDEQPAGRMPVILDAGSDRARLGFAKAAAQPAASLPTPKPVLTDYWERVAEGFDEACARLAAADADGRLEPAVEAFGDCRIRMVLRSTEAYEEVARMLWHPISLHDEPAAVDRATELFVRMAEQSPAAPSDPAVIAAEIADLLHGDIPYFGTTPGVGRLTGPGGTHWLPGQDLVANALEHWRGADLAFDRGIIRATLVSAYLNADWTMPSGGLRRPAATDPRNLDRRRTALAADLVRQVRDTATRGSDGTATWIAPVLSLNGWVVQPLSRDLYTGVPGVALLLAAYRHEVERGRADPVDGVSGLFDAAVHTMRLAGERSAKLRSSGPAIRPREPGGWVGLGSELWTWLTLRHLGAIGDEALDRARDLAALIPEAIGDAEEYELVAGPAGAIVPLLDLAAVTGERRWADVAAHIGTVLCDAALPKDVGVAWPAERWPGGLGGCAHGASGIGWALARLALATGDGRAAQTARAAFAFEESCYDAEAGGWLDLREIEPGLTADAWCHGSVGIALTAADLARRGWKADGEALPRADVLPRAAVAAYAKGMGWNHTLCHGELGVWELMDAALRAGCAPPGVERDTFEASIIAGLEENGAVSGMARDAFSPAMMSGLGGVAYQLLRMAEGSELPSVLVLDDPF